VCLSTYDGDESHVLDWSEFVAFLAGRRNPYVTVSLYPKAQRSEHALEAASEGATEDMQAGDADAEGGFNPK
jgi:hypothetical protein